VGAYQGEQLVGFVYLAWDGGGCHAFVLDPTVHPAFRRRGIGGELIRRSVQAAEKEGIEWVHVDFEPALRDFYHACGFVSTDAGLLHLEGAGRRTVP
jgi:predicted N-acetyltransferase YhbS